MGEAEIYSHSKQIIIQSHIITYGNAVDEQLTEQVREEIETMWNEPAASLMLNGSIFNVVFRITAELKPNLSELEVLENTNPLNNYFRIEEYVHGNISFVDGISCNTGYFKLENLYKGSTTAAHEYGHTIGLDHPKKLDIRGQGTPGIMYPRGTLVDPDFQYDPSKPAGVTGGTMHPMYRKVRKQDIDLLNLHNLFSNKKRTTLGDFSNVFHWNHSDQNF